MPEDSFPIIGYIAAYLVNPLLKDYVLAIAFTSAVFLSLTICFYIFLFKKILEKHCRLSSFEIYVLTAIFFLLHFLAFQVPGKPSQYLFGSVNLTCIFHYTIPGLLNLCLVEYFIAFGLPRRLPLQKGIPYCSLLIFAIYLAIFSNVFHSIILIAFISSYILITYNTYLLSYKKWNSILKENSFLFGILTVWLISLFFEINGGRSQQIGASLLHLPIKQTLLLIWNTIRTSSRIFLPILLLSVVFTCFSFTRSKSDPEKEKFTRNAAYLLLSAGFAFLYLILVCAKAGPGYITRADVLIGPYAILIILTLYMAAFILEKYPKLFLFAPIALLVIAVNVMKGSYAESTVGHVLPKTCYMIDNDLINQIIQADQNHQKEMILHVPKENNRSNWPHPIYIGNGVSRALYRHGIIGNPIKISIQPDTSMNKKYNLPIQK